jgi:hypothetical protein
MISTPGYTESNSRINCRGFGRKRSLPNLIYHPGVCLAGLRKAMKDLRKLTVPVDLSNKILKKRCLSSRLYQRYPVQDIFPYYVHGLTQQFATLRKLTNRCHAQLTTDNSAGQNDVISLVVGPNSSVQLAPPVVNDCGQFGRNWNKMNTILLLIVTLYEMDRQMEHFSVCIKNKSNSTLTVGSIARIT